MISEGLGPTGVEILPLQQNAMTNSVVCLLIMEGGKKSPGPPKPVLHTNIVHGTTENLDKINSPPSRATGISSLLCRSVPFDSFLHLNDWSKLIILSRTCVPLVISCLSSLFSLLCQQSNKTTKPIPELRQSSLPFPFHFALLCPIKCGAGIYLFQI